MQRRARALRDGGVLTAAQCEELVLFIRGAFEAFAVARRRLGAAASDYDALRDDFIACRRHGHKWDGFVFIGFSVGGGYGRTFQSTCERCGMVSRRYKKADGRANGSTIYEPPAGYSINGSERLRRSDVEAIETIAELDDYLRRFESTVRDTRLRVVNCA